MLRHPLLSLGFGRIFSNKCLKGFQGPQAVLPKCLPKNRQIPFCSIPTTLQIRNAPVRYLHSHTYSSYLHTECAETWFILSISFDLLMWDLVCLGVIWLMLLRSICLLFPNPMPYPHPAAIPVRIEFFSAYFLIHRCTIAFLVPLCLYHPRRPSHHLGSISQDIMKFLKRWFFVFIIMKTMNKWTFLTLLTLPYFTFQTADRSQEATVATDGIKYKYMQNICHLNLPYDRIKSQDRRHSRRIAHHHALLIADSPNSACPYGLPSSLHFCLAP